MINSLGEKLFFRLFDALIRMCKSRLWACLASLSSRYCPHASAPTFVVRKVLFICFPLCFCCCSVTRSCPTLFNPIDCSTPGFLVPYHVPESAEVHVLWISDAIQPSHPLSSPSPPAFCLYQNQDLFQWVGSLYQVAKVLKLQLQPQSFQWVFEVYFL